MPWVTMRRMAPVSGETRVRIGARTEKNRSGLTATISISIPATVMAHLGLKRNDAVIVLRGTDEHHGLMRISKSGEGDPAAFYVRQKRLKGKLTGTGYLVVGQKALGCRPIQQTIPMEICTTALDRDAITITLPEWARADLPGPATKAAPAPVVSVPATALKPWQDPAHDAIFRARWNANVKAADIVAELNELAGDILYGVEHIYQRRVELDLPARKTRPTAPPSTTKAAPPPPAPHEREVRRFLSDMGHDLGMAEDGDWLLDGRPTAWQVILAEANRLRRQAGLPAFGDDAAAA